MPAHRFPWWLLVIVGALGYIAATNPLMAVAGATLTVMGALKGPF